MSRDSQHITYAMDTELRLAYLEGLLSGLYDGRYPDSRVCRAAVLDVLTGASHRELDDSRYAKYVNLIAGSRA